MKKQQHNGVISYNLGVLNYNSGVITTSQQTIFSINFGYSKHENTKIQIVMRKFIIVIVFTSLLSCDTQNENSHTAPTHNFTVERLIILNEKNEIFMTREQDVWGAPSFSFDKRQYVKESIDSLANAYGLSISRPELRGYFGFKYKYHPFATRRAFYVAEYISGNPIIPAPMEEFKWMSLEEVIENSIVDAWKDIFKHILENPNTVWGASFEVYRDGSDHRTRTTESFYPLFKTKEIEE